MRTFINYLLATWLTLISSTIILAQPQEFTDEAAFIAALGSSTPSIEDYSTCAGPTDGTTTLSNFTITENGFGNGCNHNFQNGPSYWWRTETTLIFNAPKSVFGTKIIAAGDRGPITITLMTDDGQSYIAVMSPGGATTFNERFFGVISDMNFTMAIFTSDNPGDGLFLDDTYCASSILKEAVPTLNEWGVIILALMLSIFGMVAVLRQRDLTIA